MELVCRGENHRVKKCLKGVFRSVLKKSVFVFDDGTTGGSNGLNGIVGRFDGQQ